MPGTYERCNHRWTSKECPECAADNDIAARYCSSCKAEIVDPNEKLRRDFARVKKDPYAASTDAVLDWKLTKSVSASGNETLRVEFVTEYRSFTVWFTPTAKHTQAVRDWEAFSQAVYRGHIAPSVDVFMQHIDKGSMPSTVTYARRRDSDFYRIFAYNKPEDKLPA